MNTKILTHETNRYTYHIIKTSKTTYEQDQEYKAERKYKAIQKTMGIILVFVGAWLCNESEAVGIFPLLVGLFVTLTKEHAITI
jgi:hypothetical protein